MDCSRRRFLQTAAAGSAAALGTNLAQGTAPRTVVDRISQDGKGKKLLVLGGTRFLGPHLVDTALSHGWEVTLFNRGKSAPEMFADLETLIGDRKDDLKALEGGKWDVVIDTSGYVPAHVKASAELLAENVGHYVFISTVSVYDDKEGKPLDEDFPVGKLEDETVEEVNGETYGPLKALCEQAAEAAMPGRVTVVRPGLIVGPLDNSGRFTYWPWRVAQGGEILAPGNPNASIEFIDVRDLADFTFKTIHDSTFGIFNANGPGIGCSMQELLHGCKMVLGADAKFTWVPDKFLLANEVGPWMEMPLWIPAEYPNGHTVIARAVKAGLAHRPPGETIRDTYKWSLSALDHPRTLGRSLKAEKEIKVLELWHNRPASE
ncbi:MAG: SDR family oxidoreductase [Planctomycetota bacterium]|jgi:2'-hydroxyisoflavone reductase|nr:SDR family oxidoreductase [Planctomycetota bacterium]